LNLLPSGTEFGVALVPSCADEQMVFRQSQIADCPAKTKKSAAPNPTGQVGKHMTASGKKLICCLFVSILSLLLAGCGDNSPGRKHKGRS